MDVDATLIDELETRALKAEAKVADLQREKATLLALQAGAVSVCDELKAEREDLREKLWYDEGEFLRLYEKVTNLEALAFRRRVALQLVIENAQKYANGTYGKPVELERYFQVHKYIRVNLTDEDVALLQKAMAKGSEEEPVRWLKKAEDLAKEASLMIEDEYHVVEGCRFTGAGNQDGGQDGVACWACLVQDKLAEIRVEKLTREGSRDNGNS